MDKNFCQQIDQESLVEQYIAGNLRGELLEKFEQHIKECEDHAQAVLLEKAFKRGVTEFARGEIKTRLRHRLKKREDTRFLILRYAAILFVAVITPLIIYYQFNIAPEDMVESVAGIEHETPNDKTANDQHDAELKKDVPDTKLNSKRSIIEIREKKPVHPVEPASASNIGEPEESIKISEGETPVRAKDNQWTQQDDIEEKLKVAEQPAVPKLKADYPLEQKASAGKSAKGLSASKTSAQDVPSTKVILEINRKVIEDSLAIRECIESTINRTERENYKITLDIHVFKSGNIGEIKIITATHKSTELENCLFQIIKQWAISEDVNDRHVYQEITYP
jgi:hypothetical protein